MLQQLQREINAIEQELRTLLADELGRFSNNQPAIWKGANIPDELKTTGLQVIIFPVAQGETIPMSANQTFLDQSWTIELINFDRHSPALAVAKRKIEANYVLKQRSRYQAANDLFLEQCRCFIYKPSVINRVNL